MLYQLVSKDEAAKLAQTIDMSLLNERERKLVEPIKGPVKNGS